MLILCDQMIPLGLQVLEPAADEDPDFLIGCGHGDSLVSYQASEDQRIEFSPPNATCHKGQSEEFLRSSPGSKMSPPTDPPSPEPSTPPPRPDLTRRYQLQVCFPEPGETDHWDTIKSFPTAIEALRGASECHEAVKDLLGSDNGRELEPGYFKIRILDAEERRLVLWEDEAGGLIEEASAFEAGEISGTPD